MQAPHEETPAPGKVTTPVALPPLPAPRVASPQGGYWTEPRVIRWGSTVLTLVLGIGLLVTLTLALAGPWSLLWVPWLIAVPVAAFTASIWRKFLDAEAAAARAQREWENRAVNVRPLGVVAGDENPNWRTDAGR